jgi:hypothetical protein
MAERKVLRDAISVGGVHDAHFAETAAALGVFGLQQVPATRVRVKNLASGCDLETFGHGLLRFDAFGTTHNKINFLSKRARNIGSRNARSK